MQRSALESQMKLFRLQRESVTIAFGTLWLPHAIGARLGQQYGLMGSDYQNKMASELILKILHHTTADDKAIT